MYEVDHGLLSTDDIKIILSEVLNGESPIKAILLINFYIIFIDNNFYFILEVCLWERFYCYKSFYACINIWKKFI